MPEDVSYREWLEDFRREVRSEMGSAPPPAPAEARASGPDWFRVAEEIRTCQQEIATLLAEIDRLRRSDLTPPEPPRESL